VGEEAKREEKCSRDTKIDWGGNSPRKGRHGCFSSGTFKALGFSVNQISLIKQLGGEGGKRGVK